MGFAFGCRGLIAAAAGLLFACSASGTGLGGASDAAGLGGSAAGTTGPGGETDSGAAAGTSSSTGGSGGSGGSSSGGSPGIGGGPPSEAGVGDASPGDAGGADAAIAYGDCCTASSTPGCSEKSVEQCVCQIDATCCALSWNASCVLKAFTYDCAACPDGGVTTGAGGSGGAGGDCCLAHSSPGCGNASIQACVCGMDSYCCQYEWDSLCANEASSCGTC